MSLAKPKVLVVVGPTASGKSDLAVALARKFDGEIISADSRQVYKGLDIGSGKITKKEMRGVKHYLLDVADPKKTYSVSSYQRAAQAAIAEVLNKDKLPIIVGGTGFYIQAAVDNIILPEVAPNQALRKELSKKSAVQLFNILKKLDPARARDIDKHNPARLIRAIEIAKALGKVPKLKSNSLYEPLFIGIKMDQAQLEERITERLMKRFEAGMNQEVANLHKGGVSWKRLEELGLEYKYIALYLQKKISMEQLVRELATAIRQYAKRQITWFKRDKRIHWLGKPTEAEKVVKKFLQHKTR